MSGKCAVSWLLGLIVCAGCDQGWEADYSQLDLVKVSGRITLDGAPLTGSTVIFECPDKTFSYGETDEQGNYSLMFNSEKSGVLPGPKVVRIQQGGGGAGGESAPAENSDGTVSKPKETIPACYGSKSQLQATVAGRSQTIHFDLKSDGSVKGPAS